MAVSQTLLRQLDFTLLNRATSRPRPMLASSLSAAGRVPGRQSGYYGRDDARPGNRARRSQSATLEFGGRSP